MPAGPDDEALNALAKALAGLTEVRSTVPNELLGALGASKLGGDLTVDYGAAEILGHPLVVWTPQADPPAWWGVLTTREQQVALLITDGLSNSTIAKRLALRISTVKDHVHAVLKKSGLKRRTQVAALLAPIQDKLERD